jgi:HlyD family secretion protein
MKSPLFLTLLAAAVAVGGAVLSVSLAAPATATATATAADDTSPDRPALTVSTTRLAYGTLPRRIAAYGSIAAWQEASVGNEADGLRLVAVHANVGDTVRRGQLLASFAPERVQAELAHRRAAIAEAHAALAEAAGNAGRARQLRDSGALSQQQVQQQLAAEAAAQARLDAALAAEKAEQLRLAQTRVLAPDDGVISARSATVGAVLSTGQELFRLVRGPRLEWRAEVAAADLARLGEARTVHVTLADGEVVRARLRQLAPLVDPQTRNGLAYVDLPRGGSARPGMFVRGEFELGDTPAATLPRSAVQQREGLAYVFRVGADARVVQTPVTLGREAVDRIEIVGGLASDERVVVSGAAFLGDNDRVRVVAAAEGAR